MKRVLKGLLFAKPDDLDDGEFPMKRVLEELGLKRIIYPCINMFPMKRVLEE